jgi:choline dehydrogenase-like flavoprotein
VNEAIVRSFEQLELRVRARFFVICCGGIETPRLLLNSNSVESNGIGNRHDMVGRFFQDHPTIAFPIHVIDRKRFNRFYNSFRSKGIRYVIKLAASKSLQRRARILNVGAEVYYPSTDSDSITAARTLLRQIRTRRHLSHVPRTFLTAATRVDKVALAALSRMIGGVPTSVGSAKPHLAIFCEQVPNPASRISLSTDADRLGLRRAVLDWRMTTHEVQSAQTFLDSLATEWARMGMALIDKTPTASSEGMAQPFAGYGDAYHHMGSTRMGTDPKSSVVDAQCRVHGYDNLYIGSASVFPTGGFSNPTFTLIALSLRIADQLKDNLGLPRRVPA